MAEDKVMEPVDEGMAVVPDAPLADVPTIIPELEGTVSQLATDVSFARKTWKDGSSGGTPITAAELNRLEKGVTDLTTAVNVLRDSVSRTTIKYEVWAHSFEIEMPVESIAICLCGLHIATIWRSSTGIYMSELPSNYSGEKTSNGVKLTHAGGESAWAAIVVA